MGALAELVEVLVLAVVQGLGEFLPISSSGHVVIAAAVFDRFGQVLSEKLTVNIILHLGTLLAILIYYRRRIVALLTRDRRTIGLLLVGTIPAGVIGVAYKKFLGDWLVGTWGFDPLENAFTAGLMLLATGVMLLAAERAPAGEKDCRDLSYTQALLIGFAQAVAILPGISRSGSTIVAGLFCRLKREEAAAFSFLLAIPAIAGAGLIESLDLLDRPTLDTSLPVLLLGAAVACIVGLAALRWVIDWLLRGRLRWFATWVFAVGGIVIVWQLAEYWLA
ncbi:MAG: undecaprenyl-diphosphate phosphatase [Planctomycetota bacterium]|nr:MAG: undecaprenyl-diphosphate phosphatase [Planctomycetota bacterium]